MLNQSLPCKQSCARLSGLGGQKNPLPLFSGTLVPWEKLNQRSHSCSVVPSVDKGWAVQCGRTVSMFSTDGCMPGPQFDNPVEGYGLCLKLGSQSKAEQWAQIVLPCVCWRVCVLRASACVDDLNLTDTPGDRWTVVWGLSLLMHSPPCVAQTHLVRLVRKITVRRKKKKKGHICCFFIRL